MRQRNSRLFTDNFNLQPQQRPAVRPAPPLHSGPGSGRVPNVKGNKKGPRGLSAGTANAPGSVIYYNKKTHSLAYGAPVPQKPPGPLPAVQTPLPAHLKSRPGPKFPAPTYNGFKPIQPFMEMNFKPLQEDIKHPDETSKPEKLKDEYINTSEKTSEKQEDEKKFEGKAGNYQADYTNLAAKNEQDYYKNADDTGEKLQDQYKYKGESAEKQDEYNVENLLNDDFAGVYEAAEKDQDENKTTDEAVENLQDQYILNFHI